MKPAAVLVAAVLGLVAAGTLWGACTPAERQAAAQDASELANCAVQVARECAADSGVPCSKAVKAAALADCLTAVGAAGAGP